MSNFAPFNIQFIHFVDGTTALVSHQDIPEFMNKTLKFIQEDALYASDRKEIVYIYIIDYSDQIFDFKIRMQNAGKTLKENNLLWHQCWQLHDNFWWEIILFEGVFFRRSRERENEVKPHFCRIIDYIEACINE